MARTRRYTGRGRESRSKSPTGPCSPRESVAVRRGFRSPMARCSLGLRLSRDIISASGPAIDTGQLPRPSREAPSSSVSRWLVLHVGPRSLPTQGLDRSLSRSAVPPRFPTFSRRSTVQEQPQPGLCVHLGSRATSPRSVEPSLSCCAVPTEAVTTGYSSLLPAAAHRATACRCRENTNG
jgi:hypothetical protein